MKLFEQYADTHLLRVQIAHRIGVKCVRHVGILSLYFDFWGSKPIISIRVPGLKEEL